MPIYIRHLPGSASRLVDEKAVPQNHVMFNPSYSHPILYLRINRHSATQETNIVVLHNVETKQSFTIESPDSMLQKTVNLFQGIEDLRICWFDDKLWFSGTCTHASPNMTSELVVGHFNKELTKVERMSHVDIGSIPVKNVCPFVLDNKLMLLDIFLKAIYVVADKMEVDVDDETRMSWTCFTATKVRDLTTGQGLSIDGYRGSTSPVHLHGNTWGCVVHDIIFNDQASLVTRLSYIHHWVEFDVATGVVSFVSSAFWVAHWGIEYVSGIYMDKNENTVTLYLGVNDNMPVSFKTTLANIRHGK